MSISIFARLQHPPPSTNFISVLKMDSTKHNTLKKTSFIFCLGPPWSGQNLITCVVFAVCCEIGRFKL